MTDARFVLALQLRSYSLEPKNSLTGRSLSPTKDMCNATANVELRRFVRDRGPVSAPEWPAGLQDLEQEERVQQVRELYSSICLVVSPGKLVRAAICEGCSNHLLSLILSPHALCDPSPSYAAVRHGCPRYLYSGLQPGVEEADFRCCRLSCHFRPFVSRHNQGNNLKRRHERLTQSI